MKNSIRIEDTLVMRIIDCVSFSRGHAYIMFESRVVITSQCCFTLFFFFSFSETERRIRANNREFNSQFNYAVRLKIHFHDFCATR